MYVALSKTFYYNIKTYPNLSCTNKNKQMN